MIIAHPQEISTCTNLSLSFFLLSARIINDVQIDISIERNFFSRSDKTISKNMHNCFAIFEIIAVKMIYFIGCRFKTMSAKWRLFIINELGFSQHYIVHFGTKQMTSSYSVCAILIHICLTNLSQRQNLYRKIE